LNGILKEINKSNKLRLTSLESEIRTLDESVDSIKRSIEKAIEKEKENIQSEIDTITEEMNSKKEDYKTLKEKVEKIKEKESQLNEELDNEKKQYIHSQNDIKNVQREIDLYDSGKCPTCRTDFNSDHFINLRQTLIEKKESFENIRLEIESNIKSIKEKQLKLKEISDKTTTAFNDLNYLLRNYKAQIDKLSLKKRQEDGKESIKYARNNNISYDRVYPVLSLGLCSIRRKN
jgi:DNA repair exonuclease SbcCD ATPase subunit